MIVIAIVATALLPSRVKAQQGTVILDANHNVAETEIDYDSESDFGFYPPWLPTQGETIANQYRAITERYKAITERAKALSEIRLNMAKIRAEYAKAYKLELEARLCAGKVKHELIKLYKQQKQNRRNEIQTKRKQGLQKMIDTKAHRLDTAEKLHALKQREKQLENEGVL